MIFTVSRKTRRIRAVLLRLAYGAAALMGGLPCLSGPAAGAAIPRLGVYIWGGYYQGDTSLDGLAASVRFVLDQGFGTVRIAVSPRTVDELHLGKEVCASWNQIACVLDRVLAADVFRDARLKTLILTLSDYATFPERQVDQAFVAANRDRIADEYHSALVTIDRRLADRPIDVVVTNWEGDNMVYCGGVYRFAQDRQAHRSCGGGTAAGIRSRLDGLMAWFDLRRSAVVEYRPTSSGLRFHYAIEFNSLHILEQDCKTDCDDSLSVFRRLKAGPRPVLCSYSAYDSINRNTLDRDLDAILKVCDQVMIGEIGFPIRGESAERSRAGYAGNAPAIVKHADGIFAVVFWNAFEAQGGAGKGYGLWTAEGAPRNITALPEMLRFASPAE